MKEAPFPKGVAEGRGFDSPLLKGGGPEGDGGLHVTPDLDGTFDCPRYWADWSPLD